MIEFFKNILSSKKEKEEKIEIDKSNLDDFIENKKEEIFPKNEIERKLKIIENIIDELSKEAKKLENEEIKEKYEDIPGRERKTAVSHKEDYAERLKSFTNNISVPEELDLKNILNFTEEIKSQLDNFSKKTARSFSGVQHLFTERAEKIKERLQELNNSIEEIESIESREEIQELNSLLKLKNEINETKNKIKNVKNDLKNKKTEFNTVEESIEKNEDNLESLKESEKYSEFKRVKKSKNKLKDNIKSIEKDISSKFSALQRTLRKYAHITRKDTEELINNYLDNPSSTILEDDELKITEILNEIINSDEIDLDKSKGEEIKNTKEDISDFRLEYSNYLDKLEEKKEKLDNMNIKSDINKIENNITEKKNKLNEIKNSIEEIEKEITKEKKYLRKIYNKIENKFSDIIDEKIKILK